MRYLSLFLVSVIRIVAITALIGNMVLTIQEGKITPRDSQEQAIAGLAMVLILDFLIEAFLLNKGAKKKRRM